MLDETAVNITNKDGNQIIKMNKEEQKDNYSENLSYQSLEENSKKYLLTYSKINHVQTIAFIREWT